MSNKNKVLEMEASEFIQVMEDKFPTWFEKLNLNVGLVSLGFAMLAFKSDEPELMAWALFLVVLGVVYALRHYFPKELKDLRKKKDKSTLEKVIHKGVEKEFLGVSKIFFSGIVYWVGLASLFAVANGFKDVFLTKLLPLLTG